MIVESCQGGGWLGAFSWPIVKGLYTQRGQPDERHGVSVGAINEYLGAAELWDAGDDFWHDVDDDKSLDGIEGYLRISPFKGDGYFSMIPMAKKLHAHVSLKALKCPLVMGISDRRLQYHALDTRTMKRDPRLRKSILASCAMAAVMDSVALYVDGSKRKVNDGGHVDSLHPAPGLRPQDHLTAILHHPLEAHNLPAPLDDGGMLGSLSFLVASLKKLTHERAVRWLELQASCGVVVNVYAPTRDLGDSLCAKRAVLDDRENEGENALRRGPVRL